MQIIKQRGRLRVYAGAGTGSRRIAKVFEARTQRKILLIDGVKWLIEKAGFQIFKAE